MKRSFGSHLRPSHSRATWAQPKALFWVALSFLLLFLDETSATRPQQKRQNHLLSSLHVSHLPQIKPARSPPSKKSIQLTPSHLLQLDAEAAKQSMQMRKALPLSSSNHQTAQSPQSAGAQEDDASPAAAAAQAGAQRSLLVWPGTGRPGRPVAYHNGSVLTGSITVYLLFYGDWASSSGDVSVIVNFLQSISSTAADNLGPSVHKWWNLLLQYTQKNGSTIAPQVSIGKIIFIPAISNATLSDGDGPTANDDIFGLVEATIQTGSLPLDPRGLYMVLTSADVRVGSPGTGFCGQYCGWHSWKTYGAVGIPYLFVGDPTQQCTGCGSSLAVANGHLSADTMITSIAHELAEAASNPIVPSYNGWYSTDMRGTAFELADVCNRIYRDDANNFLFTNGQQTYMFNMYGLNGYKYLVQGVPDRATQKCSIQGRAPSSSR